MTDTSTDALITTISAELRGLAVVSGGTELSRENLFIRARDRAVVLAERVAPDFRVGLVDTRDDESIITLVACLLAGRSIAMLGVREVDAAASDLARRARCSVIAVGGELRDNDDVDGEQASPLAGLDAGRSPEAVLLFTSGTTGQPKGVRLSRANVLANLVAMLRTTEEWGPDDRLGQVLTISHSFGLSMVLMALSRATPIVMLPDGAPSRALSEPLEAHGVTAFACVPYFLRLMARRHITVGEGAARGIRHLYLAGGGLADDEIDQLMPDFDGSLYLMYGFTETAARAAVRRHGDGAPSGSVGLPLPGTHVDIVTEAGNVVAGGGEGLIRATSPSIMIGYLGDEPRVLGEPFTTSDLGRLDDAGNLFITGRDVEMMNFRGNRISVVRVEAQAMQVDGVMDARAIPDSRDEDAQCLVRVVLAEGADLSAVRKALVAAIDPRGIIRAVEEVDSLPKTRSGKAIRYGG